MDSMKNMTLGGIAKEPFKPGHCTDENHVYPKIYAGDPQNAVNYFNRCICGKKKKVTTVKEVDA